MKSKLAGSTIDFNAGFSLKLKEEIGSGSFSQVYSTNDPRYVVKMINASDPKSLASYNNEKFAFKTIPRHENIIYCPSYKDSVFTKGINFCCLALENCTKGSIISMIVDKKVTFQEHQIFRIIFEVILAVHQMHSLSRPITHRDLKGENILLGEDGYFKLTDFGSISTKRVQNITPEIREDIEEDIDKNTTPTIRAPEQCDLYSGYPITEKVDIWGIGCLLYILCFHKQPFESKLATVNCQYFMPDKTHFSKTLLHLFPYIFRLDPRERPNTLELLAYFEMNTKSSLNNFVTSAEKINQSEMSNYSSQTGPAGHKPNKGPSTNPKDLQRKALKMAHSHSEEANKIKPQFTDMVQMYLAKISTKTEAWMLSALEENEDGPNQVYVQCLVVKAWLKPPKIHKFYSLLYKKYIRNPDSTAIILKSLITLHTYFRKGPNHVYMIKEPPSAFYIINSINQGWANILARDQPNSKDKIRNKYTTQLIVEYSALLLEKYHMHRKYDRIFQGNYALEPYFSMPIEENSPISAPVIDDLLNFLKKLTIFHKMLLLGSNLLKIQCSLASGILDEEYCLISVLAHLIATFKYATNYIKQVNDKTVIERTVRNFEEKFTQCYQDATKFFEFCGTIPEFSHFKHTIPRLQPEVTTEILEILILMNFENKTFQMKKYLNHQRSICNLTIPHSYNEAIASRRVRLDSAKRKIPL